MTPEIREKLLGLINDKAYNPLKKEELALIFDIHSCEKPMFDNFLEELQNDGYIVITRKDSNFMYARNIDYNCQVSNEEYILCDVDKRRLIKSIRFNEFEESSMDEILKEFLELN